MSRPSWDQYFLAMAAMVATRSTCARKQVGCVLVDEHHFVIATGYGGSIPGQPHCIDVGCDIDKDTGGCIRTVHAESNAVAQAASHGVSTRNATAYITLSPCHKCFQLLVNSGIKRIIYSEQYRIPPNFELAASCGLTMKLVPLVKPDLTPSTKKDSRVR